MVDVGAVLLRIEELIVSARALIVYMGSVVVGRVRKGMRASCIGAAGMTSGFGPSYQECPLLYRKLNFLRRLLCHACASRAERPAFRLVDGGQECGQARGPSGYRAFGELL